MRTTGPTTLLPVGLGGRALAIACATIVLIAGVLALEGPRTTSADDGANCEATDLGTLSAEGGALETDGRWTTEDCDSRFRIDSDAHTYRFQHAAADRIRIDLMSAGGDSYLYLLAEDGSRITDNDDGGADLNARIERNLAAGVYLVEVTTVGGRGRGPADFTLSIGHVTGCEPVHLGTLQPGGPLAVSGSWTLDTCGSRVVAEHPAHAYSFNLPQDGRVLIDLTSVDGDPVLSLATSDGRFIGANDDGGGLRNSRLEQYLAAGTYLIEATTYRQRDLQPLTADFDLVIDLVDEEARQNRFQLKIEATHAPDQVIAGEPFAVHYRAGNPGGGDLVDAGGSVVVYVVAPRVFERTPSIVATPERWQAGVAYHSGAETASATSIAIGEVTPFSVTFWEPGPSWVFVAIIAFDEADKEIAFHGIWRNLMVLSGPTFGPVTVSVDGGDYEVSATADEEGIVTTTVASVADAEAEVDAVVQAKATYAAGVHAFVLDGIFERPGLAGLPTAAEPYDVSVANASSSTLLKSFAEQYADAIATTDLLAAVTAGEAVSPVAVEDLVLHVGNKAGRQYASLAASWSALQERVAGGEALSFAEAFALQSELAYAERILGPVAATGDIVAAAREAEAGWQDPAVQALVDDLAYEGACGAEPDTLGFSAMAATAAEDLDGLSALDAELRAALPVFGYGTDAALCGAIFVDGENARFLQRLGIVSAELADLNAPDPAPAPEPVPPPPHALRIIARADDAGRVEHGVELAGGEQILPSMHFLPADTTVGMWYVSSDVEVGGSSIGQIRSRRLADGRIELGFRAANGEAFSPDILFLPAERPEGVWFRSGEIEVPPAPEPVAEEEEASE